MRASKSIGCTAISTSRLVVCLLLHAHALGAQVPTFDPSHLLRDVETYVGFGVHRTAHPGDLATSEWLSDRLRAAGLDVREHEFTTPQFLLEEASIEDPRGRIEAFPIWLPRGTGAAGVTGRLVLVTDEASTEAIRGSIAWLDPAAGAAARAQLDRKALAAGAAAIVFATTDGAGLGLFQAVNAERAYVDTPRPVPTVTFGAAASERLLQSVGRDVTVRITGRIVDQARAVNVLGTRVVDPNADWIVISTPSSGWFTNGGERGPGIALLLALAEWVGGRRDGLNYSFVATSGHELDFLGARLLHEAHLAPPPERTRVWLHLGAQIATPPWTTVDGELRPNDVVTAGTLQASPELAAIMSSAFAELPMYTLRTDTRIGEFRDLIEHGYRGLGIVSGSNPWFHVPRDDARSVSAETLARVASALVDALMAVEGWRP
jgi:hypothetical protein